MAADSEAPGQGSETSPAKEIVPQIAEAWGTSRAYVYKLKKKGCPVDNVDAATKWREEHAARGVGFRSKGLSADSRTSPQSLRKDEKAASQAAELPKNEKPGNRRNHGERPIERVLASMWDSLEAAISIETEAYRLVREGQKKRDDALIGIRISAYTKAQQGRFDAEERYRKEMERQKILVPLEEAKRIGRRAYDIMLPLLRAMGKSIGPAVNPADALASAQKIDTAVEAIIRAGRGAYDEPPPEEKPMPVVKIELPDDEETTEGTADVGDPS